MSSGYKVVGTAPELLTPLRDRVGQPYSVVFRLVLRSFTTTSILGLFLAGSLLSESPRTLFIAIDAVPFSTMVAAQREPGNEYLRSLRGPVPLISTFPSTTSLALAAILQPVGVKPSPGYEAKHYDWNENRVSGGGLLSYEPFPWREFFDWKIEGLLRKGTSAVRPIKASRKDIRQSLDAFLRSEQSSFFIYYDVTDAAGHLRSPAGLKPILKELDTQLRQLKSEHPETLFQTVIFSDHGMAGGEPLHNVRKGVLRALAQAGFHRKKRILKPQHVVFVPFGLVSSFVVFTHPGREREAAAAIVGVGGIDLCVFPEAEGWRVLAADGSALIRRRQTSEILWSYELQGKDPLGLADVLGRERLVGSWLSDDEIFQATHAADYPDPLHRISRCFDLVKNPASIVCSVARDSMYGSKLTAIASRLSVGHLRWTHGALDRQASLGFLMSDVEGWQPQGPVRFDDALQPFLESINSEEPSAGIRHANKQLSPRENESIAVPPPER